MVRYNWRHAIALAFGVALVVALVLFVGPGAILDAIQGAAKAYLLLALASYALFFLLRGLRWRTLLRPVAPGVTFATTSSLSAVGWLVSTFVPMKAGDLTRTALVARRERAGLAGVAGTVVVERALDVFGLAVACSVGLLSAALLGGAHLPPFVGKAVLVAWSLPILGLLLLLLLADVLRFRPSTSRIVRFVQQFLHALEELRRIPRDVAPILGLTLLLVAAQVGVFVALFLAFVPGAPLPLVVAGVPLFLLTFVIAVVPGNVGTYEAAFVAVFTLLGFDPESLLSIAVAVHLLTMSIVTLLGGGGFALYRLAPQVQTRPAPEAEAPA